MPVRLASVSGATSPVAVAVITGIGAPWATIVLLAVTITAACPLPVNGTFRGEAGSLLVIVTFADLAPMLTGANFTLMVHDAFEARGAPQVLAGFSTK